MRRFLPILLLLASPVAIASDAAKVDHAHVYRFDTPSRDGTGKYYMGREISQVLGHRGATWLERSEREGEERPNLLVSRLELRETDVVADIGAGSGYLTFRLSERLPSGRVLAVDIQTEMLEVIDRRAKARAVANVATVLGDEMDPRLPEASIDVALMVDAYHEFSHPREMMQGIFRALRPGGRVVLVEYRGEDPDVPIKPLHKMTESQARREMESVGLIWRKTHGYLPRQHVMVYEKPATGADPER